LSSLGTAESSPAPQSIVNNLVIHVQQLKMVFPEMRPTHGRLFYSGKIMDISLRAIAFDYKISHCFK
jgi:hypothetical protein